MTEPKSIKKNRKPNKLINEKSPYLLQHAYNPVNWNPWGEEAFTKAKEDDKPILVSIGYYCCHWCRVHKRYYTLIISFVICS
ncbi:thioredoxin domain-containing protein [Clostridium estertheticum]|nr:thioredoxin domain-containing protein [Clostridium estertheticum]